MRLTEYIKVGTEADTVGYAMANVAKRGRPRRGVRAAAKAPEPSVKAASRDTAISPQEFYGEMVERPDVRRILTRLAQVEDGRA
jgi:hypothetical protein